MCSLFGVILILHLPYTMLLAKESLLVMYGEIANRSLSQHLVERGLTEPMTIREACLDEDKSLLSLSFDTRDIKNYDNDETALLNELSVSLQLEAHPEEA